jgi:hypothetical protein
MNVIVLLVGGAELVPALVDELQFRLCTHRTTRITVGAPFGSSQ